MQKKQNSPQGFNILTLYLLKPYGLSVGDILFFIDINALRAKNNQKIKFKQPLIIDKR